MVSGCSSRSRWRHPRPAAGPRVVPHNRRPKRQKLRNGSHEMRVLLSTYGSRGDVEPMVGLAVQSRALGAEVRVCAPPDFAELLAGVGVPLVPIGQRVRPPVTGTTPPSAAEECAAPVATGVLPTGVWR